jgi:hypothetical protein
MLTQLFALIQLVLRFFKLWDQFQDFSMAERLKENEERRQRLEKAVEDQKNAQTEDEFDRAQDEITKNLP